MELSFEIPRGMKPLEVAQTFTAYLLGAIAFKNLDGSKGPYQMAKGGDASWQLDPTNDYWLHLSASGGSIVCRCQYQEVVIQAMIALFNAHVANLQ